VECSCDFPHTLRCTGDRTALKVIIVAIHNCHYIRTCILKDSKINRFYRIKFLSDAH
jgi:hypothetical protein